MDTKWIILIVGFALPAVCCGGMALIALIFRKQDW